MGLVYRPTMDQSLLVRGMQNPKKSSIDIKGLITR